MAMKSIKQKPLMSCQPRGAPGRPNHGSMTLKQDVPSHLNNERGNSKNKQDTNVTVNNIHFTYFTFCINILNPEDYNYKSKNNHNLELFAVVFGCPEASLHLLTSPLGVGILQRNVRRILRVENSVGPGGCLHLSPLKTNIRYDSIFAYI